MSTKTCTKCGQEKPLDAFEERRRSCKECRVQERKARRKSKGKTGLQELAREIALEGAVKAVLPSPAPTLAETKETPLAPLKSPGNGTEELKADFRKFLFVIWRHLGLPDPTPAQYDIAHFITTGPDRICIQAFRGIGKSFVTAAYVAWELWKDPQKKIMVVSATKIRADDFSTFLLRLIHEVPLLRHLRPREGQRASKIAFDVGPATADQSPSVKSVGITGQMTGSRADIIISDDVEVVGNSATADQREKLLNLTKEYSAILKPLPTSRIIYLGTPQTEDSIYNKLSEVFTTRIWPARLPTSKEEVGYAGRLAPMILKMMQEKPERAPTDPVRFDDEDLKTREADYGKAGFALQFMLSTQLTDAEKYPLKVKDLVIADVHPERAPLKIEWLPDPDRRIKDLNNVAMQGDHFFWHAGHSKEWQEYEGSVMAIDPSGRGKDETGYAVVKMLNGFLYVRRAGGLQGGYDEQTLIKLSKIAREENVNLVTVEANFGDGMFTEIFKPVLRKYHECTVEEVKHSVQKERRIIDTLEPVIGRHKLVIDRGVIQDDWESCQKYDMETRISKMLIYQLSRICYDRGAIKHDDRLDALAMAVAYWVERMARDADQGIRRIHDDAMQRELEDFMENAFGQRTSRRPLGSRVLLGR